MGLFSRFKSQPKMTPSIGLPFAEPGLAVVGSHYFEENIGKVPVEAADFQVVAAPDDKWGKVQVFWQGLRIGNLSMDELQERALLKILLKMGPAGTVFAVVGKTLEERAVDLNVKGSKLHSRRRVRIMIPVPERLDRWCEAAPADRAGIQLSEPKTVQVRLKGQGTVQETLERLAAGTDEYQGTANISVSAETSGKYKGIPVLTCDVKGDVVGVVGGRYREEESELFDAVLDRGLKTVGLKVRRSTFGGNALYSTVDCS